MFMRQQNGCFRDDNDMITLKIGLIESTSLIFPVMPNYEMPRVRDPSMRKWPNTIGVNNTQVLHILFKTAWHHKGHTCVGETPRYK